MLRYRGKQKVLDKVRELDAFPKVPEEYVDSTPVGGTFSLITFLIILFLIYSEVMYYLDSNLVFKFVPDTEMDEKLRINIDITIAMPCSNIGADILDSTSQSFFGFGELDEEDTWFELELEQRDSFDAVKYLNSYLREEYHSIWKYLWKRGHGSIRATIPPRKTKPNRKHDACRLNGVLILNKVSGNFHITPGKSLHLPMGHIHLSMLFDDTPLNFSHRINRLSFGSPAYGIIYPLEGDERLATEGNIQYQYHIEVVPTDIDTTFETIKTYQYSCKELERPGNPGIFFKYDMAALKIKVYQERENLVTFILRLFSVIGGIYFIVGFINTVVSLLLRSFLKTTAPNVLQHTQLTTNSEKPRTLGNSLLITPDLNVPLDILNR